MRNICYHFHLISFDSYIYPLWERMLTLEWKNFYIIRLFIGFNVALTSKVISRRCLLVAVVLWPMCCHTGMWYRKQRTWHPTLSQYTFTGVNLSLCYLLMGNIILEHTTSHSNALGQPRSIHSSATFHTHSNRLVYDAVMVVVSQMLGRKCTSFEPGTCCVRIQYVIRYATAASWTKI